MSVAAFIEGALLLQQKVRGFWSAHGLQEIGATDHVCYKCGSSEEFERIRKMLEPEAVFMYQSIIARRRIAVIKLPLPFEMAFGPTTILELSDQKPDGTQRSGFDHIEVYNPDGRYEHLVDTFRNHKVSLKRVDRPHHTTCDIAISGGFTVKLTEEPLLTKIKREEML